MTKKEKILLQRNIHPEAYNRSIRRKTIRKPEKNIIIDFYNVTTTIIESLQGNPVYRGTDHIIRDNAKAEGRSKKPLTLYLEAAKTIKSFLNNYQIEKIILVGDKQIPFSKQTLAMAARILEEKFETNYILTEQADREIINTSKNHIVSSSDKVILEKAEKIYDLAGEIILNQPNTFEIIELWVFVI